MHTITGWRPAELPWSGSVVAGPSSPAGLAGGATAASGGARWLEGLDHADGGATISADLPAGARGLSAAEHARRVLAALVA